MVPPLYYEREGSGTPAVFLHPIGLDLETWEPTTRLLRDELDIVCADLAGHGGSTFHGEVDIDDHADRVAGLMRSLGLEGVVLVGLSFGGMIAQCVAVRHPELVGRLVLCGCPATFPDALRPTIEDRGTRAVRGGMAAVVEETVDRWFTAGFLAAGGAEGVRRRLATDDVNVWAASWRAISRLDNVARLGRLAVPTLCVAGEFDASVPPAMVEALAGHVPGGRYVALAGAPHMMQIESADALAQVIREFALAGDVVGDVPRPGE